MNDTKDDSSVATVDITVLPVNAAPQANAAGPYVALVNSPIVLNGAGTSDVDNAADTLVYQWDMNYDGTQFDVDATGKQPSMTFNAVAAPRTIALRATDPAGLSNISTTTLQVVNGGIVGRRVFYNNSKYDGNNKVVPWRSRMIHRLRGWHHAPDADASVPRPRAAHAGSRCRPRHPSPATVTRSATERTADTVLSTATTAIPLSRTTRVVCWISSRTRWQPVGWPRRAEQPRT